ncbi:unnamed protein product [Boreogadus saida]
MTKQGLDLQPDVPPQHAPVASRLGPQEASASLPPRRASLPLSTRGSKLPPSPAYINLRSIVLSERPHAPLRSDLLAGDSRNHVFITLTLKWTGLNSEETSPRTNRVGSHRLPTTNNATQHTVKCTCEPHVICKDKIITCGSKAPSEQDFWAPKALALCPHTHHRSGYCYSAHCMQTAA